MDEQPTDQNPEDIKKEDVADIDILKEYVSLPENDLLPWENVELPSEGAFYGGAVPGGRVRVRPMGMHADKILATSRLASTGESIDYLFRECVEFPGDFDPLQLLVGDRTFLLYYLRGITYGNEYEFAWACPSQECKQSSVHTYNLNELYETKIEPDEELGKEPFKVVLPKSSEWSQKKYGKDFWVEIRLMRGTDLRAILRSMRTGEAIKGGVRTKRRQKRKDRETRLSTVMDFNEAISKNLQMVIVSVMGDKAHHAIHNVVEKMHSADAATIRAFLRDKSPGIDTQVEITCPHCGNMATAELPITESFFRPKAS